MAKSAPNQPAKTETVLLVESEVLIRFPMADYLRECGYRVIEAHSSDEAVTVLNSGTTVDLMLADARLQGAHDGFGLAQWVRANRPKVKVILTSGVERSAELAGGLCESGPLLSKPYHQKQLARRIKLALARAATPPTGASNAA